MPTAVATSAPPTIEPVTRDRIDAVATTIARAFFDNEAWAWVLPSERRREGLLRRYYASVIRHTYLPRGEAWMTADAKAGALWFPPSENPHLQGREQLFEMLSILPAGPVSWLRGSRSEAATRKHHPSEPHYYLNVLAVDPDYQRRGYGAALIAPMLERADAERMPSYLETQRESNVPYYARFGFELTKRIELPGGPPLWLMWREARSG